uniref:Myb/SANT-like DNA-binding domain-containing protein 4 n=1 Tax=Gouania willdenowi TaxID=441366 RepID=A0A8C5DAU1_GOUWI
IKRKSNYSVRETQTLIQEIHKRKDVLFSRQQNTAINELKRQAWEEVAQGVNTMGEGELRTATEVKRRYLDWRALTKKKQLQEELSLSSSSSSSVLMKTEYDQTSPEHEAASDCRCDWPELASLGEPGGEAMMALVDVKTEEEVNEYRVSEIFSNSDLVMLSSSKDATSTTSRVPPQAGHALGVSTHGLQELDIYKNAGSTFLIAIEKQRMELERQRLAVETERLAVEKERLLVEKERLRQMEVERERLQLEKERILVEKERLRLLLASPPSSSTSSLNSSHDGPGEREKGDQGWVSVVDLETEKINLEKERVRLEKERLQFFKFEAGRLQIERERLQVEKERMQLHKEHH